MFKNKSIPLLILMIFILSIGICSASDLDASAADYSNDEAIPISDSFGSVENPCSVPISDASESVGNSNSEISDLAACDENLNDYSVVDVDDDKESPVDLNKVTDGNISQSASKKATKISANKVNTYYKEKTALIIHLKDSNSGPLKNKRISLLLNGRKFMKSTDDLGRAYLNLDLKPGSYKLKINFYGDDCYASSSLNSSIKIKKAPLSIKSGNAISYYHKDTFFKVEVINKATKNPIEGIRVLFKVFSSKNKYKAYHAVSDKDGIAILAKRLSPGKYNVSVRIDDSSNKPYISYKNPKGKYSLQVMDVREMGCSSIYLHANENESAIAFRRDSTYAAKLYIVVQKWNGRYVIKQYKLTGTYFFHAILSSDGWMMGTGGWDNPVVNRKIESLSRKIVTSNSIKNSYLKSILKQERKLNTGHFAIVAPDGRYAVVWKSGYIKGKLKNGEYLDVPNLRPLFHKGKYKKFSNDPAKAALKIAASDRFGVNRRNIMVYHYKRSTKDFRTSASVKVYGANDKGNLAGRHTAGIKDNVCFKKKFISKFKLSGTPNMKFIGSQDFGSIDKLIKKDTKLSAPKVTNNYNQSSYLKLTLRDKKSNILLKGIKIGIKVFTGSKYSYHVIKTNKDGIALFNTKSLNVGDHSVKIASANNKYMIFGKSAITIKEIKSSNLNSSEAT